MLRISALVCVVVGSSRNSPPARVTWKCLGYFCSFLSLPGPSLSPLPHKIVNLLSLRLSRCSPVVEREPFRSRAPSQHCWQLLLLFFFWERRKNFWTLPSRLFKNKNETIAGSTGDAAYVRRPTRQNKMKCWRAERERHWGKHDARRDLDSTALERNRKWLVASLFCGNLAGGNRYDCYNLLLKRKARGK